MRILLAFLLWSVLRHSLSLEEDAMRLKGMTAFVSSARAKRQKGDVLSEPEIIRHILQDYDRHVRPKGVEDSLPDGGPVVVTSNMYIRYIGDVDVTNMMTFRQMWTDPRLAYSSLNNFSTLLPPFVVLSDFKAIWRPDTFFQMTFRQMWTDPRLAYSSLNNFSTLLPPFVVLSDFKAIWRPDTFFQMTFRQMWTDPRLAYSSLNNFSTLLPPFVVLSDFKAIWRPDTFFQNEKTARRHTIDKNNVLIRIYSDGSILYSVRLSFTFTCIVHLHRYPFDTQRCTIDFASYAYTTNDIFYVWKNTNPIQLKAGVRNSLASYNLKEVSTAVCTSKTNTGEYSCLRTYLVLGRQVFYYFARIYIPTALLVFVSWVSFWLDRDAVPARVTLGVTTILTIITQSNGVNASLPPVAYVKAIDIWCGACLLLIFAALIEYAVVVHLEKRHKLAVHPHAHKWQWSIPMQRRLLQHVSLTSLKLSDPTRADNSVLLEGGGGCAIRPLLAPPTRTRDWPLFVDRASRVLFPLTFLAFNAYYWTTSLA